jgi:hypothetical protein
MSTNLAKQRAVEELPADLASIVASLMPIVPGGRLTLADNTPLIKTSITGADKIVYTPMPGCGNRISLHDGEKWNSHVIPNNVTQLLSDTSKSPAAAEANSVYDVLAWIDGSTLRISRSIKWQSATARGTGTGTAERDILDGMLVNKHAVTNGPAAGRGLVIGVAATNGDGTIDMMVGSHVDDGGADVRLLLANIFNRRLISAVNQDSAEEWEYHAPSTRPKNNSAANRFTFVRAVDDDDVQCWSGMRVDTDDGVSTRSGIGLDSTTLFSNFSTTPEYCRQSGDGNSQDLTGDAHFCGPVGEGLHYLQALERGTASSDVTTLWRDRFLFAGAETDANRQGMRIAIWA